MTRERRDLQAGAGPSATRRRHALPRALAGEPAAPPILVQHIDPDPQPATDGEARPAEFPSVIPILPLRGLVGYPNTPIPLTIGQPRSIRLIDDVVGGDRLVGLVASREPEIEQPGPEPVEGGVEIEAQLRAVKDQFRQIAELVPSLPRELLAGVLLLEEPLHVIYTVANYQRMELETAQAILDTVPP